MGFTLRSAIHFPKAVLGCCYQAAGFSEKTGFEQMRNCNVPVHIHSGVTHGGAWCEVTHISPNWERLTTRVVELRSCMPLDQLGLLCWNMRQRGS